MHGGREGCKQKNKTRTCMHGWQVNNLGLFGSMFTVVDLSKHELTVLTLSKFVQINNILAIYFKLCGLEIGIQIHFFLP